MKLMGHRLWPMAAVTLLVAPTALPGQDAALRKGLSDLATHEVHKSLDGKKVKLDGPRLSGMLKAVEPQKNIRVAIDSFRLENDQIQTKMSVSGLLRLDAKVKGKRGASVDAVILAKVRLNIEGTATLLMRGDAFFIKPVVNDLAVTMTKMEVRPKELGVEEENVADALNEELKANKEKLKKHLNATLKEQEIK